MAVWFTSDQHYDHKNIIRYCSRPFDNMYHMVESMIARHNERVAPEDDVWHLGDFALNARTVPNILPRLNGVHRLVMGNHDAVHPMKSKSKSFLEAYRDAGFTSLELEASLEVPGIGLVRLSHMPYLGDSRENVRYIEWRPKRAEEKLLVHGHVHEKWKKLPGMINVGVDVWDYRPVSLEEIVTLYSSGE